jgi:serine/threonine protein phosphatase 1
MIWKFKSSKVDTQRARLPKGLRVYAIGDVHGRIDLLDDLLARIDADRARYPAAGRAIEVFLGDYVDRGPSSCAVIDRLIERARISDTIFLKGNHEAFVLDFLKEPGVLNNWRLYGGLDTLMSYGLSPSFTADASQDAKLAGALKQAMPSSHFGFLSGLVLSFTRGDFFFVHAGVRPGVPLSQQREDDLLWIREDFLLCEDDFGKIVVHGHTPVMEPDVRPNRINIDTGAYATGKLTCLILEENRLEFL